MYRTMHTCPSHADAPQVHALLTSDTRVGAQITSTSTVVSPIHSVPLPGLDKAIIVVRYTRQLVLG